MTTTSRNELLLSFLQHGSRPLAYIIIAILVIAFLFSVRDSLLSNLSRAEDIRYGDLLITFAKEEGVIKELKVLSSLSEDQMFLFFIIAKDRGGKDIYYKGKESREENYRVLEEKELITIDKLSREEDDVRYTISEEGLKLHALLWNKMVKAIRLSESE